MGNAFKKKSAPPATAAPAQPANPNAVISDQDRAILQLKVQKDRCHKYTQKIAIVIKREVEIAKQLLKQDKKQNALLALKRKKYQEKLLSQTERQMLNLEELVHSIQFASMQAEVFAALQHGNSVLSALNSQTSLEDVEQLMEETREAVEYQEQVSQLMGTEIGQADLDDIDETIRGWEEESLSSEVAALPDVPVVAPVEATTPVTPKAMPKAAKEREVVLS